MRYIDDLIPADENGPNDEGKIFILNYDNNRRGPKILKYRGHDNVQNVFGEPLQSFYILDNTVIRRNGVTDFPIKNFHSNEVGISLIDITHIPEDVSGEIGKYLSGGKYKNKSKRKRKRKNKKKNKKFTKRIIYG